MATAVENRNVKWGDVDEEEGDVKAFSDLPPRTESKPDKDGVKQVTEYHKNEKGEIVKVVKRVRVTKKSVKVSKHVLERRQWKKFGDCRGLPAGPEENITYQSFENVKLNLEGKVEEKSEGSHVLDQIKNNALVVCRNCGETGHWTLKCPKRNQNVPTGTVGAQITEAENAERERQEATAGAPGAATGKYVPPRARMPEAQRERDRDEHTLRVTNLSEDTTEADLVELFRTCGHTTRVYLAKDHQTNQSRGFAFVNFLTKEDAQNAIDKLDGHGYDNLILRVEWAKPRKD